MRLQIAFARLVRYVGVSLLAFVFILASFYAILTMQANIKKYLFDDYFHIGKSIPKPPQTTNWEVLGEQC